MTKSRVACLIFSLICCDNNTFEAQIWLWPSWRLANLYSLHCSISYNPTETQYNNIICNIICKLAHIKDKKCELFYQNICDSIKSVYFTNNHSQKYIKELLSFLWPTLSTSDIQGKLYDRIQVMHQYNNKIQVTHITNNKIRVTYQYNN